MFCLFSIDYIRVFTKNISCSLSVGKPQNIKIFEGKGPYVAEFFIFLTINTRNSFKITPEFIHMVSANRKLLDEYLFLITKTYGDLDKDYIPKLIEFYETHFHEDFIFNDISRSNPYGPILSNKQSLIAITQKYLENPFRRGEYEIFYFIEDGGKIMSYRKFTQTFIKDYEHWSGVIIKKGQSISSTGFTTFHFKDGKFYKIDRLEDNLKLLKDIGILDELIGKNDNEAIKKYIQAVYDNGILSQFD